MVNQGYRKTDIGIIPDEWSVIKVKDIVTAPLSYGVNAAAVEYDSNLPQYIRITDITDDGRYDSSNKVSIDIESLDKYTLSVGDILFARTGASTGKTYLYTKTDGKLIYAGFLIRASIDTDKYDPYYVFLQFHTPRYYDWVSVMSTRSGQPGINGKEYGSYQLPMPSLDEQKAIATALSDIDALIANLEKLIAKKKAIKQGAMQELLTGKRRLPGFDGEWKTETWGDVLSGFSSGATPYRGIPAYYKGNIKWVSSGELNYNVIHDTLEHISSEAADKTSLTMHPEGTFLMAITGLEAAGTRGSCALLGAPATTNQSCMAIYSTSKMTTSFLFHYYTLFGDELALKYCQGTKQQSYTAAIVKILPITYPVDIDEQNAITAVLNDMNSEISALEEKLTKALFIKSGMMSELLTGNIRLLDKEDV